MKTFKDRHNKIIGTLVFPHEKITCPYCFEHFHVSNCRVIATKEYKDNQGNIISAPNQVIKEVPTGLGSFTKYWVKPLLGPDNIRIGARRECPYCKHSLPRSIEFIADKTIAIVGQTSSGKSHYLTSLIKDLQSQNLRFVAGDGSRCVGLDQSVDDEFNSKYITPVFHEKQKLAVTDPASAVVRPEPLIFTVYLKNSNTRFNLMFYDVAGEDMRVKETRDDLCNYIMNASAMIYLIDPMVCERIPSHLPAHIVGDYKPSPSSERIFLNSIIGSILEHRGQDTSGHVDIPTVFALSKADILQYLSLKNENGENIIGEHNIFFRTPDYRNGLQIADMEGVSQEVEALLAAIDPDLYDATRSFKNVRYAAVSATGCSATESDTSKKARFPFIEPKRCLDPLLWCLYSLGLIEAK